ncbi:MAG: hypothetical protein V3V22_04780 [Methylococcales bacterium]
MGKHSAAAQRLKTAEQGYLNFLRVQPQTFSQHTAQFFYDTGKLPQALELAELNLQNRQDINSWLLLSRISKALNQPCLSGCLPIILQGEPIYRCRAFRK